MKREPGSYDGTVEKKLTRDERLASALTTVRESVISRLGVTSMEEARQRPLRLAAELDQMIQDYHGADVNGENYFYIEATSEMLDILESALAYEGKRQTFPKAAEMLT